MSIIYYKGDWRHCDIDFQSDEHRDMLEEYLFRSEKKLKDDCLGWYVYSHEDPPDNDYSIETYTGETFYDDERDVDFKLYFKASFKVKEKKKELYMDINKDRYIINIDNFS